MSNEPGRNCSMQSEVHTQLEDSPISYRKGSSIWSSDAFAFGWSSVAVQHAICRFVLYQELPTKARGTANVWWRIPALSFMRSGVRFLQLGIIDPITQMGSNGLYVRLESVRC